MIVTSYLNGPINRPGVDINIGSIVKMSDFRGNIANFETPSRAPGHID